MERLEIGVRPLPPSCSVPTPGRVKSKKGTKGVASWPLHKSRLCRGTAVSIPSEAGCGFCCSLVTVRVFSSLCFINEILSAHCMLGVKEKFYNKSLPE